MVKIEVDKNLCMGCGICTSICSEIFELGEDGKARVICGSCESCDPNEAVLSCPEQAITILEG